MAPRPPLVGGTVLITGASSGIGREMARLLAEMAGTLVLVARRRERLESLAEELTAAWPSLRLSLQPCDLADPQALARMVESATAEVGPVDVLINNAGLGDLALFEHASWEKIERMLRVNVLALTALVRLLLPSMLARHQGGILNVSSGLGLVFLPGLAAYSGTKHYVTAFSEALRLELRGTGIVVSQTCPGPVETEFLEVAGNPMGRDVPRVLQVSAARCARATLNGFARGRSLIVPGSLLLRVGLSLGRLMPRAILRSIFGFIVGWLRRRKTE